MAHKVHKLAFLLVLGLAALAHAQTFTVLHSFTGGTDGSLLEAGVIQDPAGNLYGTTVDGGSPYYGVVFKLNSAGTETVLYSFTGGPDGGIPFAPVARDKAGNLYGTTGYGGVYCLDGCGTVFKVDTAGNETVLHSFAGGTSDGCYPDQGLIGDAAGNLYGTTSSCGSFNAGTIFQIDHTGRFTLLHSFAGTPSDGGYPEFGHLAMDNSGNLYGLTVEGGSIPCKYGCGVLYKLSKSGALTVLHRFGDSAMDGCYPYGSVVGDSAGNIYGTTLKCGSNGYGTIWQVSPTGKETILHNFAGGTSDGAYSWAGVTRDSKGNLYGITEYGGSNNDGVLYELTAEGNLTLLHSFDSSDGEQPVGEVLRTTQGTLFGTTQVGGTYGGGTVWSYVP